MALLAVVCPCPTTSALVARQSTSKRHFPPRTVGAILQALGTFGVLVLLLASPLSAQVDPSNGVQMWSTNEFGIDLATSAINVQIPGRSKGGPIPFSSWFGGTNHAYTFSCNGYQTCVGVNGWILLGYFDNRGVRVMNTVYNIACGDAIAGKNFSVEDLRGAVHPFPTSFQWNFYPSECASLPTPVVTTDGSGYTLVPLTNGQNATFAIYDSAGRSYAGTCTNGECGAGLRVSDPDGNSLYSGNSTVQDSLGSTPVVDFSNPSYVLSYATSSGSTVGYKYEVPAFNLKTNFGCANEFNYGPGFLITSLTLPDGGQYAFAYEPTPNGNGFTNDGTYFTGRIAKITFPDGGSISYAYSGGHNGFDCESTVPTLRVTMDDNDGHANQWTYVNTPTGPGATVVKTDPAGNQKVYYFSGEFQVQAVTYNGGCPTSINGCTGGNTILQTTTTCYNQNFTTCLNPYLTLPISQTDVYTSYNGSSSNLVETKFDATYGNVLEVKLYDFGAAMPPTGNPISDTVISYGQSWNGSTCTGYPSGTYIANTPCYSHTMNSSGVDVAATKIAYNGTGHPISTSQWVSGTSWLTSTAQFSSTNGTMSWSKDAAGNQTTYGYTGSTSCNNLLLTSTALPISGLSTSQVWDCNGAVLTSSIDVNGQPTSYGYVDSGGTGDPFWRNLSVQDPQGNLTWTKYSAAGTLPATVETYLNFPSSSPTATVDSLNTLDGLGRVVESQMRTAPGSTSFDRAMISGYSWDSAGPVLTQTLPSGTGTSTTHFDALGRTTSVSDTGGGTVTYAYSQTGNKYDILITSGPTQNFKKQLEYDGLGRSTSVCEITAGTTAWPGGNCAQGSPQTGYWTQYTYDALGNLQTVLQNAQASGMQSRTYIYDGLSRLTSESNPETSNTGSNGTTTYTYDNDTTTCGTTYKGDLVKKVDPAGNKTCNAYDALHRVTGITYPSDPNGTITPAKKFLYDSTTFNCSSPNVKGRLAEAYTYSNTGRITDLGYCYSPRGETTDVFEATPNSGGTYHTSAAYFGNGVLQYLNGIPGDAAFSYGVEGEGRTRAAVTGTVNNPSCSSSNTPLQCATYNSSGQLSSVTLGSGDSDGWTYDPLTGRMKTYQFIIGPSGSAQSVISTLGWNANGALGSLGVSDPINSSNTQNCTYAYDDLARAQSVNCVNGSTNIWNQSFAFDPFGNISKVGNGGTTFAATYNTSNQETSVASCVPMYDTNGNLTKDCTFATPATYAWDADGNAINLNGTSITYDAFDRAIERGSSSQILYTPIGKIGTMNGQNMTRVDLPLPGGDAAVYTQNLVTTPFHYRHADWLGSSRFGSSAGEAEVYDRAFAPYGENYAGAGVYDLDFTGQTQDQLSGLYGFLFRQYNPIQGRWISPDPAGLASVDPTNPQSWNRYAYAMNNPLSMIDPSGLHVAPGDEGCRTQLDGGDVPCGSGLLGGDSTDVCPFNNCGPIPIPGHGFAFPSMGMDGSMNWSFSFSAEYKSSILTDAALAEMLGLPIGSQTALQPRYQLILTPGLGDLFHRVKYGRCADFYGGQGLDALQQFSENISFGAVPTGAGGIPTPNHEGMILNEDPRGPFISPPIPNSLGINTTIGTQSFIIAHELAHDVFGSSSSWFLSNDSSREFGSAGASRQYRNNFFLQHFCYPNGN